jgi:hypothetical protein
MTTATRGAEKTDLFTLRPAFFHAARKPELVELREVSYLAIEGRGAPEQSLPPVIGAMFSVAYGLKFKLKARGCDFKVCPVQAQWWFTDDAGNEAPNIWEARPEQWHWRLLLMVPDFVTAQDVEAVKAAARISNPLVTGIALVRLEEGLAVQVMHFGPYEAEAATIAAMRELMAREGLEAAGRHHEVYLGDPRRAKPEKLKTILRQPVRRTRSG